MLESQENTSQSTFITTTCTQIFMSFQDSVVARRQLLQDNSSDQMSSAEHENILQIRIRNGVNNLWQASLTISISLYLN